MDTKNGNDNGLGKVVAFQRKEQPPKPKKQHPATQQFQELEQRDELFISLLQTMVKAQKVAIQQQKELLSSLASLQKQVDYLEEEVQFLTEAVLMGTEESEGR